MLEQLLHVSAMLPAGKDISYLTCHLVADRYVIAMAKVNFQAKTGDSLSCSHNSINTMTGPSRKLLKSSSPACHSDPQQAATQSHTPPLTALGHSE